MKSILLALTGGLLILMARPVWAVTVEADPDKEYVLTPEAGPYAICVKGYTGSKAASLAHQLVLHLPEWFSGLRLRLYRRGTAPTRRFRRPA